MLLNFRQEISPDHFENIPETFTDIQYRQKRTAFYWLIVAILLVMPSVAHIFTVPFFLFSNNNKMANVSECINNNNNNLSTEIDLNETLANCQSTVDDFVMSKTLWSDIHFFSDSLTEVQVKITNLLTFTTYIFWL